VGLTTTYSGGGATQVRGQGAFLVIRYEIGVTVVLDLGLSSLLWLSLANN